MWRITLYQMRKSAGRLIAAGVAIMLGTGFVAATLLASDALTRATYDAATADYAQADLVVRASDDFTWADLDRAAAVDGVAAAAFSDPDPILIGGTNDSLYVPTVTTTVPELATYTITSGAAPQAIGEIALPQSTATSLSVSIGDEVPASSSWMTDQSDMTTLTVVGISTNRDRAHMLYGATAVMTPAGLSELNLLSGFGHDFGYLGTMVVVSDPGASFDEVGARLDAAIGPIVFMDRDEAARQAMASYSNDQDVFTAVILAFAGLALVVAALVISNTFQVLVAQRTRTLALLRCTGASRSQLRRSVLTEGSILALVSSALGVLAGAALVQGALVLLDRVQDGVPVPSTISFTLASVLAPIIVGVIVTLLACLAPAREATRVAPLAALQPLAAPSLKRRAGKLRATLAIVAILLGGALLALGLTSSDSQVDIGLLLGVAGGAISFAGLVIGAVFWLPPIVRGMGFLINRVGPASRLATANALRNPRRTVATSTALLIGVTLVTTMSVGAASARATLANTMDQAFPFDVSVTLWEEWADELDSSTPASDDGTPTTEPMWDRLTELTESVNRINGIADARPALTVGSYVGPERMNNAQRNALIIAMDPADVPAVINGSAGVNDIAPGTIVVSEAFVNQTKEDHLKLRTGDQIHLGVDVAGPEVTVLVVPGNAKFLLADPSDVRATSEVESNEVAYEVIARLTSDASATDIRNEIYKNADGTVSVLSPAAERAMLDSAINTVLAVIIGLLAIAVIIAMIGVANTLSLSVIERRRESATLRAVGLSRAQLRRMLAIEGMFIAGVGGVVGVALGLIYGWIGSATALGLFTDTVLVVPWRDFALVLAITLAAGLLASVLPARGALKTPPVAALAVD